MTVHLLSVPNHHQASPNKIELPKLGVVGSRRSNKISNIESFTCDFEHRGLYRGLYCVSIFPPFQNVPIPSDFHAEAPCTMVRNTGVTHGAFHGNPLEGRHATSERDGDTSGGPGSERLADDVGAVSRRSEAASSGEGVGDRRSGSGGRPAERSGCRTCVSARIARAAREWGCTSSQRRTGGTDPRTGVAHRHQL